MFSKLRKGAEASPGGTGWLSGSEGQASLQWQGLDWRGKGTPGSLSRPSCPLPARRGRLRGGWATTLPDSALLQLTLHWGEGRRGLTQPAEGLRAPGGGTSEAESACGCSIVRPASLPSPAASPGEHSPGLRPSQPFALVGHAAPRPEMCALTPLGVIRLGRVGHRRAVSPRMHRGQTPG